MVKQNNELFRYIIIIKFNYVFSYFSDRYHNFERPSKFIVDKCIVCCFSILILL